MTSLRFHITRHRRLAALLLCLALALKLLVPAGYMLETAHGPVRVTLCSGTGPMDMAMPGMKHSGHKQDHKAEQPCAYSGLTAPALGGADPVLLALAIMFVFALAIRPSTPPLVRAWHFQRPPLRGPPFTV